MSKNKHFQLLRKGGYNSLESAKSALVSQLASSLPGEPIIAYYKNSSSDTETHILLGIGGQSSGYSVFYNAESVVDLLTQKINSLDYVDDDKTIGQPVTSVTETNGVISVSRATLTSKQIFAAYIGNSSSSGIYRVVIPEGTVNSQLAYIAQILKEDETKYTTSSLSNAIGYSENENGSTITFKLSSEGATPDMLSVESDGLKMSNVYDCGSWS